MIDFPIFRENTTENFGNSIFLCTFAAVINLKID